MAVRSLTLQETLRRFCLAAFAVLTRDADGGAELPFAFEEHRSAGKPALYEYRPLARGFVEERLDAIEALEDTRIALEELARLPQTAFFARAHAGSAPTGQPLVRSILLPLVVKTVERCGGLDWDDHVFARVYDELERSLFADRRAYAALTPLVGVSSASEVELAAGMRVRSALPGELSAHWPEAAGLLPDRFGRDADALLVLEWQRAIAADRPEPPDAPGELADAVTALRLATAGAIAGGPVVFERLDWRAYGIRPLLPIAAVRPAGDPAHLEGVRARVARTLLARLASADLDPEVNEALDRWELSLFQGDQLRAESLRAVLERALGAGDGAFAAALRAAVLLGDSGRTRRDLLAELRNHLSGSGEVDIERVADVARRVLVELLLHGERAALIGSLDDSLLGARLGSSVAPGGRVAAG